MDDKMLRYYFDNLKDKSCNYVEANNLYLISTIKDIADNCKKVLSEDELYELFKTVRNKVTVCSIDVQIEKIIWETTDWCK
jgi:hypothetical protein